jgi:hypothetical protein
MKKNDYAYSKSEEKARAAVSVLAQHLAIGTRRIKIDHGTGLYWNGYFD